MIDFSLVVQTAIANAISGIIANIAWFILIILGVKVISKKMPEWISEYWRLRDREMRIKWAKGEK